MEYEKLFFPWIKVIQKKILGSFPEIGRETLQMLFDNIHDEMTKLNIDDKYRIEVLYSSLNNFYLHFCWKVNWNKECYLQSSCVQILYYMSYLGLILSNASIKSAWLNKVFSTLKSFPGDFSMIYDVLLLMNNIPSEYFSAYGKILKSILQDVNMQDPVEAECFIKIMLLFRRLKSLMKVEMKEADIYDLASKVNCPSGVINFLISLNIDDLQGFKQKNIIKKFLNKKLNYSIIKRLFKVLFKNKYDSRIISFSPFGSCSKVSRTNEKCNDLKMKNIYKNKRSSLGKHFNNQKLHQKSKNKKKKLSMQYGDESLVFNTNICNRLHCTKKSLESGFTTKHSLPSGCRDQKNKKTVSVKKIIQYPDSSKNSVLKNKEKTKVKLMDSFVTNSEFPLANQNCNTSEQHNQVIDPIIDQSEIHKDVHTKNSTHIKNRKSTPDIYHKNVISKTDILSLSELALNALGLHSSMIAFDNIKKNIKKVESESSSNMTTYKNISSNQGNMLSLDKIDLISSNVPVDEKVCIANGELYREENVDSYICEEPLNVSHVIPSDNIDYSSPESLELNPSSYIPVSSRVNLLERSNSIYTSDSFVSLSEELSDLEKPIAHKKKLFESKNVSKNFISSCDITNDKVSIVCQANSNSPKLSSISPSSSAINKLCQSAVSNKLDREIKTMQNSESSSEIKCIPFKDSIKTLKEISIKQSKELKPKSPENSLYDQSVPNHEMTDLVNDSDFVVLKVPNDTPKQSNILHKITPEIVSSLQFPSCTSIVNNISEHPLQSTDFCKQERQYKTMQSGVKVVSDLNIPSANNSTMRAFRKVKTVCEKTPCVSDISPIDNKECSLSENLELSPSSYLSKAPSKLLERSESICTSGSFASLSSEVLSDIEESIAFRKTFENKTASKNLTSESRYNTTEEEKVSAVYHAKAANSNSFGLSSVSSPNNATLLSSNQFTISNKQDGESKNLENDELSSETMNILSNYSIKTVKERSVAQLEELISKSSSNSCNDQNVPNHETTDLMHLGKIFNSDIERMNVPESEKVTVETSTVIPAVLLERSESVCTSESFASLSSEVLSDIEESIAFRKTFENKTASKNLTSESRYNTTEEEKVFVVCHAKAANSNSFGLSSVSSPNNATLLSSNQFTISNKQDGETKNLQNDELSSETMNILSNYSIKTVKEGSVAQLEELIPKSSSNSCNDQNVPNHETTDLMHLGKIFNSDIERMNVPESEKVTVETNTVIPAVLLERSESICTSGSFASLSSEVLSDIEESIAFRKTFENNTASKNLTSESRYNTTEEEKAFVVCHAKAANSNSFELSSVSSPNNATLLSSNQFTISNKQDGESKNLQNDELSSETMNILSNYSIKTVKEGSVAQLKELIPKSSSNSCNDQNVPNHETTDLMHLGKIFNSGIERMNVPESEKVTIETNTAIPVVSALSKCNQLNNDVDDTQNSSIDLFTNVNIDCSVQSSVMSKEIFDNTVSPENHLISFKELNLDTKLIQLKQKYSTDIKELRIFLHDCFSSQDQSARLSFKSKPNELTFSTRNPCQSSSERFSPKKSNSIYPLDTKAIISKYPQMNDCKNQELDANKIRRNELTHSVPVEHLPVKKINSSEKNCNYSTCSPNNLSPVKLFSADKREKNLFQSDSDETDSTKIRNESNKLAVTKHHSKIKSNTMRYVTKNSQKPNKNLTFSTESESENSDTDNQSRCYMQLSPSKHNSSNSIYSLNNSTPQSNSSEKVKSKKLNSDSSEDSSDNFHQNPNSFIHFSASDDDDDSGGAECSSEYASEVEGFIVSDSYLSDNLNTSGDSEEESKYVSPSKSNSAFLSKNSSPDIKQRSFKKSKNRMITSESENESSDNFANAICHTQLKTTMSKGENNSKNSEINSSYTLNNSLPDFKKHSPKNSKNRITMLKSENEFLNDSSFENSTCHTQLLTSASKDQNLSRDSEKEVEHFSRSNSICSSENTSPDFKKGFFKKSKNGIIVSVSENESLDDSSFTNSTCHTQLITAKNQTCGNEIDFSISTCPLKNPSSEFKKSFEKTNNGIITSELENEFLNDDVANSTCQTELIETISKNQNTSSYSENESNVNLPDCNLIHSLKNSSPEFKKKSKRKAKNRAITSEPEERSLNNKYFPNVTLQIQPIKANSKPNDLFVESDNGSTPGVEPNTNSNEQKLKNCIVYVRNLSFLSETSSVMLKKRCYGDLNAVPVLDFDCDVQDNKSVSVTTHNAIDDEHVQTTSLSHSLGKKLKSSDDCVLKRKKHRKFKTTKKAEGEKFFSDNHCVSNKKKNKEKLQNEFFLESTDSSENLTLSEIKKLKDNSHLLKSEHLHTNSNLKQSLIRNSNFCIQENGSESDSSEHSPLCEIQKTVVNYKRCSDLLKNDVCNLSHPPRKKIIIEGICGNFLEHCSAESDKEFTKSQPIFREAATDLSSLAKVTKVRNNFSNELPNSQTLQGSSKNDIVLETDNLTKEPSIDAHDEYFICAIVNDLQSETNSFIPGDSLDTFLANFNDSSEKLNLVQKTASSTKCLKPSLVNKNHNASSVEANHSFHIVPENFINKAIRQAPNFCNNSFNISNIGVSQSAPDVNKTSLSDQSLLNENSNTICTQNKNFSFNSCIELFKSQELNNIEENQASNSCLSLDQQLSQMGYEMIPESRLNITQNCLLKVSPKQNAYDSTEIRKSQAFLNTERNRKVPHGQIDKSVKPKINDKILYVYDTKKKSDEDHVIPEESLFKVLNKPFVTYKESQRFNCYENSKNYSMNSKNITEAEFNESVSEEYILVNGMKFSMASISPSVNLGKRCDETKFKQNFVEKNNKAPSNEICNKKINKIRHKRQNRSKYLQETLVQRSSSRLKKHNLCNCHNNTVA